MSDFSNSYQSAFSPQMLSNMLLPFISNAVVPGSGFLTQNMGTLGLGVLQAIPSFVNLMKLRNEQRPNYSISPELQGAYNLAENRSHFGFTPQQRGAFNQSFSQAQNTDFYNARNMGGGSLAQSLSSALGARRLNMLNQFAAQDAAAQRANVSDFYNLSSQMQRQRNLATQQDINYRMAKEQALGKALSSGLTNIASGINANQALGLRGLNFNRPNPQVDDDKKKVVVKKIPNVSAYTGTPLLNQQPHLYGSWQLSPDNQGFDQSLLFKPQSMLSVDNE